MKILTVAKYYQSGNFAKYGFVFIEMLVALSIVAILATISYFGYQKYAIKKDTSNAQQYLLELQQKQGLYYLNHRSYAKSVSELGMESVPKGSETVFEPVKIFYVVGETIGLPGGDFYTAIIDYTRAKEPPLVVSEDGTRWYEYDDSCYRLAGIGDQKKSFDPQAIAPYDALKVIANCRFSGIDKRWDENINTQSTKYAGGTLVPLNKQTGAPVTPTAGGTTPSNIPPNTILAYYNSLPSEITGNPPTSVPSTDPNCDAAVQNRSMPKGVYQNFTAEGKITSCYCTQDSVSIGVSLISGKVECKRYTACGTEPGTYIEEIAPAACRELYTCDEVSTKVKGTIGANIKSGIIYADPSKTGSQNGYQVWCSATGVLTINPLDPTLSTCYAAVCKDGGAIELDTNNNLAKYSEVFTCQNALASAYPSSSEIVTDALGDTYKVSCPAGTTMTINPGNNYQDSVCSKYVCNNGEINPQVSGQ